VSSTKGKLQVGLDWPEITGLMRYLTESGKLQIQFLDAERHVLSEGGKCRSCTSGGCRGIREQLASRALETGKICHAMCDMGVPVTATPIARFSTVFGAMLLCEMPAACLPAQSVSGCDPLVNTLASFVARSSFYELEVESLTSDLALRYEELAMLYEIGERIPIRAQIHTVMSYVVERLKGVIDCDCVCWVAQNGDRHSIHWLKEQERSDDFEQKLKLIGSELDRRVTEKSDVVTVNDLSQDDTLRQYAGRISSISGYPVGTDGEHYGTLVLCKIGSGTFHSGEAMLVLAVTRKSGVVIRNANLYHQLNELFLSTIKALVRIIEGKDAYTRGHSERVSAFSGMLADFLNLPIEEKEALSWSSLLHDIGKIKVPEEILKKPGSLTKDEFAVIMQHPGFGAEMLSPISQLKHCLPDIRHHHERIDGKGYPDRLQGDEIPLRARIIAVADTFDALTSDRCYRPRFGIEKAFQIVEEAAGTQLYADAAQAMAANKQAFVEYIESIKAMAPAAAAQQ